ncbi:MAG: hypothetical protein QXT64_01800 [Desulfurococcaceae archaeon]
MDLRSRDICRILSLIEDVYRYDCRNVLVCLENWLKQADVSQNTIRKIAIVLGDCSIETNVNVCGFREILEKHYVETVALAIMQEMTSILGVSSPYPCDPIIETMDYEKKVYAVGDPKKKIIGRFVRRKDELILKEIAVYAFPKHVVAYRDKDRGGLIAYEIMFETIDGEIVVLKAPTFPEILRELKKRRLVEHLLSGEIAGVIQGAIRSGRGDIVYI